MTALFDALPEYAEINGVHYALNTDYRVALRIIAAFEDDELADFEKQCIMIKLLYKTPPADIETAARLAVLFLNCGEEAPLTETAPLYSFTRDAQYIYSAVSCVCGQKALEQPLHWYRFAAYFNDISENSFFARLIYLRRSVQNGTLTKEERRAAAQLSRYMQVDSGKKSRAELEFLTLLHHDEKEE